MYRFEIFKTNVDFKNCRLLPTSQLHWSNRVARCNEFNRCCRLHLSYVYVIGHMSTSHTYVYDIYKRARYIHAWYIYAYNRCIFFYDVRVKYIHSCQIQRSMPGMHVYDIDIRLCQISISNTYVYVAYMCLWHMRTSMTYTYIYNIYIHVCQIYTAMWNTYVYVGYVRMSKIYKIFNF